MFRLYPIFLKYVYHHLITYVWYRQSIGTFLPIPIPSTDTIKSADTYRYRYFAPSLALIFLVKKAYNKC